VCGEQLGRFYEPELLRLDGAVLAAQGDPTAAEARLRSALTLAHERGAVAFELRAATGLAALLHGRGDLAAARAAVTEALAPFRPDVDSPDLRAARALLATLG
jgi:ATP/maltotriose-dependent transcriptional regulator MalT